MTDTRTTSCSTTASHPSSSAEVGDSSRRLFLDRYGELIDLQTSGQLAMRQVLAAHLKRVDWDASRFPVRLHPFVMADSTLEGMPIAIDAGISFGKPVVLRVGVSTAVIMSRIDAGESTTELASDYGLTVEEVEHAVLYERAA